MSRLLRPLLPADVPRRLLAAGTIALVLLLSVLGSNPELHRLVHCGADAGADDTCAVVLFGQGVSAPFDSAALTATPAEWTVARPVESGEILLAAPRHLHPPGQGPPVG